MWNKQFKSRGCSHVCLSSFPYKPTNRRTILPVYDFNWEGQDQSLLDPSNPQELPSFATHSISSFTIIKNRPIHWISKRQKLTAHSSVEVELYETEKFVKDVK